MRNQMGDFGYGAAHRIVIRPFNDSDSTSSTETANHLFMSFGVAIKLRYTGLRTVPSPAELFASALYSLI